MSLFKAQLGIQSSTVVIMAVSSTDAAVNRDVPRVRPTPASLGPAAICPLPVHFITRVHVRASDEGLAEPTRGRRCRVISGRSSVANDN